MKQLKQQVSVLMLGASLSGMLVSLPVMGMWGSQEDLQERASSPSTSCTYEQGETMDSRSSEESGSPGGTKNKGFLNPRKFEDLTADQLFERVQYLNDRDTKEAESLYRSLKHVLKDPKHAQYPFMWEAVDQNPDDVAKLLNTLSQDKHDSLWETCKDKTGSPLHHLLHLLSLNHKDESRRNSAFEHIKGVLEDPNHPHHQDAHRRLSDSQIDNYNKLSAQQRKELKESLEKQQYFDRISGNLKSDSFWDRGFLDDLNWMRKNNEEKLASYFGRSRGNALIALKKAAEQNITDWYTQTARDLENPAGRDHNDTLAYVRTVETDKLTQMLGQERAVNLLALVRRAEEDQQRNATIEAEYKLLQTHSHSPQSDPEKEGCESPRFSTPVGGVALPFGSHWTSGGGTGGLAGTLRGSLRPRGGILGDDRTGGLGLGSVGLEASNPPTDDEDASSEDSFGGGEGGHAGGEAIGRAFNSLPTDPVDYVTQREEWVKSGILGF